MSLVSAVITLLALAFMTKYFYFIPKATLSSVLVCAIIFMVRQVIIALEYRQIFKPLQRGWTSPLGNGVGHPRSIKWQINVVAQQRCPTMYKGL